MNHIEKRNNKLVKLESYFSFYDKDSSLGEISFTSSIPTINEESFVQKVLNFLEEYRKIYLISIDEITSTKFDAKDLADNTVKLSKVEIGFHALTEQCPFYSSYLSIALLNYDELISVDELTNEKLRFFFLNSISHFISEMRNISEKYDTNKNSYYPGYMMKINGVPGIVIESLDIDGKENIFYLLKHMNHKRVFGIQHRGNISVPTSIKKNVFAFRWGWFVSTNGKSPISSKKDSVSFTKKKLSELKLQKSINVIPVLEDLILADNPEYNED